ncbi:transposase [Paenibacillus sp. V4I9]|nr:transposase [Paenibacillus sp. V4I9]
MHGMNDFVVGMESTGHYWFNIANWLVGQGIDVALVNPMTTKRNKETEITHLPRTTQKMLWSSPMR